MFIDALREIVKAAERALELAGVGDEPKPEVAAIQAEEFTGCLVAVLDQRDGPIRQLVVSCDDALARAVAEKCLKETDDGVSREARPMTAFRVLCAVLECTLAEETAWYHPRGEVCTFGPGEIRARIDTRRRVVVRMPGTKGMLTLIVDPMMHGPPVSSAAARAVAEADATRHREFGPAESRAILTRLIHNERDVTLEIGGGAPDVTRAPGMIVTSARRGSTRAMVVATAALSNGKKPPEVGAGVTVHAQDEEGLVTFHSRVIGLAEIGIRRGKLPAVAIELPSKVIAGNRRGAFRVVPDRAVKVVLSRPLETLHDEVFETEGETVGMIRNISFSGARVSSDRPECLAYFAVGNLVHCELSLPLPWGKIEVFGVVRHGRIRRTDDGKIAYDVGLEFTVAQSASRERASIEAVREYVLAQQQALLRRRAA